MKKKFYSFDGLRVFGAIIICLHHYSTMCSSDVFNNVLNNLYCYGYLGVEFFLMLSGFLIPYHYKGSKIKLKDFLVRRMGKIYPLALFSIFISVLLIIANIYLTGGENVSGLNKPISLWYLITSIIMVP